MKDYVPHFNEPLSLTPELSWNLKTDLQSAKNMIDFFLTCYRISLKLFLALKFSKREEIFKNEKDFCFV